MAQNIILPAWALIGDPTTAAGAGMTNLGLCESATISVSRPKAFVSDALHGGRPKATGVYALAPDVQVQLQLYDAQLALLVELLSELVVTTVTADDAMGFGAAAPTLVTLPTLVLVPHTEKADGVGADNAVWLPAAYDDGLTNLLYNRPSEGESNRPFNVNFRSAYRATDQGATAIPADAGFGFIGPPAALGLTWFLPTIAQPA